MDPPEQQEAPAPEQQEAPAQAAAEDDDDEGGDPNRRTAPALRQLMVGDLLALLTPEELLVRSGPESTVENFPNDKRMSEGYTRLHKRVKQALAVQPQLYLSKAGKPTIPTRRACREVAQRWARRFLQVSNIADLPAHATGWRHTDERVELLKQFVIALAEGWVVNQHQIDEQEEAAAAAEQRGEAWEEEPVEEERAPYADLRHAVDTSVHIKELRDAIAQTHLTSLEGLRRELVKISQELGCDMFTGDSQHKKARDFARTRVRT